MTNGDKITALLKPREDQIKIFSNVVEIEIQNLNINFWCGVDWWYAEFISQPAKNNDVMTFIADVIKEVEQDSVIDKTTKEKTMKEFIVVHNNDNPVIILKDAVIAVKDDRETEETCLYLSCGFTIRCVDKYRDIVKALIK